MLFNGCVMACIKMKKREQNKNKPNKEKKNFISNGKRENEIQNEIVLPLVM